MPDKPKIETDYRCPYGGVVGPKELQQFITDIEVRLSQQDIWIKDALNQIKAIRGSLDDPEHGILRFIQIAKDRQSKSESIKTAMISALCLSGIASALSGILWIVKHM